MTNILTITRPDDWHLHVRDGAALHTVVPHTAAQFGRAIIMPNLKPPVTTAALALEYKARIVAAVPKGIDFEPLMTLYLTDNLPPEEIVKGQSRWRGGMQVVPCRRHHQQRCGRHRFEKDLPHTGCHAKSGHALVGSR